MVSKTSLLGYLETTNHFKKEIDGWLVDEFLYTLKLINQTKKQIKSDNGKIIINVSNKPGREVLQPSAAFASYRALVKQAIELSRSFPVSPKVRKELQEAIKQEQDDFLS
jgi:phage terminase small subunit